MRVFGVIVVFADVNHRQFPERGKIHHFIHDALSQRAFAEKAHRHLPVAGMFGRKRCAGRDPGASGNDGVGAEISRGRIGDVHRTAFAMAISRFLAQQFREHAIGAAPLASNGRGRDACW